VLQVLSFFAASILVSIGQASAAVSSGLPDSPAGRRVQAYIVAFNSEDDAKMTAFARENIAPAAPAERSAGDRLEMYHRLRDDMGSIAVERVLTAQDDRIALVVRSVKGETFTFDFRFGAAPERFLDGLVVRPGDEPVAARATAKSGSDLVAAVNSLLNADAMADRFSGVALLAHGDRILFEHAYGFASKEYGVRNSLDTRFNLGSINKLMTRIAIEQLIAQRRMGYDSTIAQVLPDYPNRLVAAQVTVRELLDMTSGIGDFFGPRFAAAPKDRFRSLQDYLPMFAVEGPAFAPGTGHAYSNGGYIVLGLMVERVSGQSYYDYVRDHIFRPAGMTGAGWFERDEPTPSVATGYTRQEEGGPRSAEPMRNNVYTLPARGSSAGGGYATAHDMLAMARALQAQTLGRGVGAMSSAAGGIGVVGGSPGVNATFDILGDSGYVLIVLSNYDPPSAQDVARTIRGWLGSG
jgi:CubicO group peptidase (beta-lactamase class C family)